MVRPLARLLAMTPVDRWLLMQALILLPLSLLGLRAVGLNRWWRLLRRLQFQRESVNYITSPGQAQRTWQLVRIAARRGLTPGNCLSRSLTLWWLLAGQGIAGDLRIGVRRVDGTFGAHAWVEVNGQPINEDDSVYTRYQTFDPVIQPVKERFP